MAGFEKRFTAEQRRAIFDMRWQEGATYTRIKRAAELGELRDDLEPFAISPASISKIVREYALAKEGLNYSRLAKHEPADAVRTLAKRTVSIAEREVERLAQRQARAPNHSIAGELNALTAMLGKLATLSQRIPRAPARPGKDGAEHEDGGGLVDRLRDAESTSEPEPIGEGSASRVRARQREHGAEQSEPIPPPEDAPASPAPISEDDTRALARAPAGTRTQDEQAQSQARSQAIPA
jgi:hypothetical protein